MNVLVTGGAGFLGSHLTERLLAEGHRVVVLDNESTGRCENVPAATPYMKGDVTRPDDLEPAFARGLDAVCHIAGQVSLVRSFTDPLIDLRTNVEGTVNVLQMCLKYRVPRLLYASSMTVYGRAYILPTPEETACRPVSYYGITKYAGERYVHTTAERVDLDFEFRVTSFRMYNVYGPRQAVDNPYQGVLSIFVGNLLRGEPLTIFGDGEQSRDFVYVSDVVDAWAGALANSASYGQVFNLGSGRQTSINRLADEVLAAFGRSRRDHEVRYAVERSGELRQVEADTSRARTALGWQPRVAFSDGLAETVRGAGGVVKLLFVTRPAPTARVYAMKWRSGMNLLLVSKLSHTARAVNTIANYVQIGSALGHEVAVFGEQQSEPPALPTSLEVKKFDFAVFVVYMPWDFPDLPYLAQLLDGMPRERRVIIDCSGRYNETIRVEHDFNHLEKMENHQGWEWVEGFQAVSDRILQPTLKPLRSDVRPFLFHGFDPRSVARRYESPREAAAAWSATTRPYGVAYVGTNWQRWTQVRGFLEAVEPLREELGRICLAGWDWDKRPDWAAQLGIQGVDTDPALLKRLGVETKPAIPYDEFVKFLGQARFSPVFHRPLFNELGLVTNRTFETFCADSLPLLMVPDRYLEEIYGPAARPLAPGGEVAERLRDMTRRPEVYWDAVLQTRAHLARAHSFERRFKELLAILES